ncbi:uroporphyrinogen-III synthase [Ferrovibrio sp.]|uniref:uroporphyrinogen-III synthase n=1 Tax=Ferrovibrio sp. TaxID=1917215 RepID=UPI0035B33099
MARLLLTRPEADAAALAEKLRARGHSADIAPLLRIHVLDAALPKLDGTTALLITSANGLRAFAAKTAHRDLTVYAVGEASARAARAEGFTDVHAAGGDLHSLADLVTRLRKPSDGPLLHAAGETLAGDLVGLLCNAGFDAHGIALYKAETASSLPPAVAASLRAGEYRGVLFFSPRTATTFVRLVAESGAGDAVAGTQAFCLSANVAERIAALPWCGICVAAEPSEAALLAAMDRELA